MSALLEARLQVHLLIRPLWHMKIIFRYLCLMGLGVCVHDAYIVNTVSTILPEVTDKEVTLLFPGL